MSRHYPQVVRDLADRVEDQARKRVIVFASRTKTGIRHRWAQEIHPASSALVLGSSTWEIM